MWIVTLLSVYCQIQIHYIYKPGFLSNAIIYNIFSTSVLCIRPFSSIQNCVVKNLRSRLWYMIFFCIVFLSVWEHGLLFVDLQNCGGVEFRNVTTSRPEKHSFFGGWWQSVKHLQILAVLRIGFPIMEYVPTHFGAGSIQRYPKVTPDYPRLSQAMQILFWGPLTGNSSPEPRLLSNLKQRCS